MACLLQRKAALASALDDDVTMTSADDNANSRALVAGSQDEVMAEAAPLQQATEPEQPETQDAAESSGRELVVREEDGDSEGDGNWAAALVDSPYEIVLLAMLEGLRWGISCESRLRERLNRKYHAKGVWILVMWESGLVYRGCCVRHSCSLAAVLASMPMHVRPGPSPMFSIVRERLGTAEH